MKQNNDQFMKMKVNTNGPIGTYCSTVLSTAIATSKRYQFMCISSKKYLQIDKFKTLLFNIDKIVKLKGIKKTLALGGCNIKQHVLWKEYKKCLKNYKRAFSKVIEELNNEIAKAPQDKYNIFRKTIRVNLKSFNTISNCIFNFTLIAIVLYMCFNPISIISKTIEDYELGNIVNILSIFMFIKPLFVFDFLGITNEE